MLPPSPKISVPFVRAPSSVTVGAAASVSWLKSAVLVAPLAITPFVQLAAAAQLPPSLLVQTLLWAQAVPAKPSNTSSNAGVLMKQPWVGVFFIESGLLTDRLGLIVGLTEFDGDRRLPHPPGTALPAGTVRRVARLVAQSVSPHLVTLAARRKPCYDENLS